MHKPSPGMIEIHVAVFLFGTAGLFGKFLSLSPAVIVFGRTAFASTALAAVMLVLKEGMALRNGRDLLNLGVLGGVLALHWTTFFKSIQVSTVAVGLLSYSTFPLFVTFMEPYLFNEKLRSFDVFTALMVFIGLILVVPSFDFENNITQGVLWGTLSGLTFAVLSLLNRKIVKSYSPLTVAFYQNAVAAAVLLPMLVVEQPSIGSQDFLFLGLLGVICTALSHALFIKGLVYVKTQLASIIAGLEPVYGIVFAVVLLGEIPSLRTLAGGFLIIGATFLATLRRAPAEIVQKRGFHTMQ